MNEGQPSTLKATTEDTEITIPDSPGKSSYVLLWSAGAREVPSPRLAISGGLKDATIEIVVDFLPNGRALLDLTQLTTKSVRIFGHEFTGSERFRKRLEGWESLIGQVPFVIAVQLPKGIRLDLESVEVSFERGWAKLITARSAIIHADGTVGGHVSIKEQTAITGGDFGSIELDGGARLLVGDVSCESVKHGSTDNAVVVGRAWTEGPCSLTADYWGPGTVSAFEAVELHVRREGRDLSFIGPCVVVVAPGAIVENVSFASPASMSQKSEAPWLRLERHSRIAAASGEARLAKAVDASIWGAEVTGLTIVDIANDSGNYGGAVEGASLENVFIRPNDYNCVALLGMLRRAAHVNPVVADTPVTAHRGKLWRLWPSPQINEGLRREYQYVRALAVLTEEKGSPGSTRSQTAWSAYRLRQLTTPSMGERFALTVYRAIGFGERPLPAFACWLLLSAVLLPFTTSAPLKPELGLAGMATFIDYWLASAVSSLSLLNLAHAAEQESSGISLLAHVLVAVPFVTGVLALRKFVKSSSGSADN